jgi:hypothetical protein
MPTIEITEEQHERLEDVRTGLEEHRVGPYGIVRTVDAVEFLLDQHEGDTESSSRTSKPSREGVGRWNGEDEVDTEPGDTEDEDEVDTEPGDTEDEHEDATGDAEDVVGETGETTESEPESTTGAETRRTTGADPESTTGAKTRRTTGADTESTTGAKTRRTTGADTESTTGAETRRTTGAETESTTEARVGGTTELGTGESADSTGGEGVGAEDRTGGDGNRENNSGRLGAMMRLLEEHDEKWEESGAEGGKYMVTLPDGSQEGVRTKDDVRALLFKHY